MNLNQTMEFNCFINGLPVKAEFSKEDIDEILLPLLKKLYMLQREKGKRLLVLLSAPPAAGKSTLVTFLKALYEENRALFPAASFSVCGMDGFHFRNDYLKTHFIERDGEKLSLKEVKGAPETFDVTALYEAVLKIAAGKEVLWPVYDRKLHEPLENAAVVTGDIVLLEGNYFLYDDPSWEKIRTAADLLLGIDAPEGLLKERLIRRKIAGGLTPEEAEAFVEKSDLYNVRLCLRHSVPADITLCVTGDGSL